MFLRLHHMFLPRARNLKKKCSRIFATSWEKLVAKHKLILKIMDSRLPVMMTSQIFLARTNPDFDRSNNEYYIFFWPLQYRIALAIDCCTALTFRFLAASWWKIHSHIFEFLSRVFTRFHVLLYMPWVSSYGGVWSLIRFIPYLHIFETWAFSLLGTWSKKSPPQRKETLLIIFGKEVDLSRNLFHKQCIYHQKSINIQQSFRLGHCAALFLEELINKQEGGF